MLACGQAWAIRYICVDCDWVTDRVVPLTVKNDMNRFKTGFLCSPSSFLLGLGSVLNVRGQAHEYNASENPDEIAIANDWRMIGQDLRDALERAATEARPTTTADHERKQAA